MTKFRRELRLHESRWRESRGHPIGSQPIVPRTGRPSRPVGSRLPLDYARETGANFVTAGALEAARARTSLSDVRFAHSPGRLEPAYLNSLRAFDAAFVLDLEDGSQGIVALDIKYHERMKDEIPKPSNLPRYLEVAERSGVFEPGAIDAVKGRSELAVMWLEHLLLLSMLEHESGKWTWSRYIVVHAAGNMDFAEACARYRALLVDESTFSSVTLEELLDAGALPASCVAALRERYTL
jgi:hypothetical protein